MGIGMVSGQLKPVVWIGEDEWFGMGVSAWGMAGC